MNNIIIPMSKALSEIDHVYGSMYQTMTLREKISYCEILINTMKTSISNTSKSLQTIDTKRIYDIITAAEAELDMLNNNTTKD